MTTDDIVITIKVIGSFLLVTTSYIVIKIGKPVFLSFYKKNKAYDKLENKVELDALKVKQDQYERDMEEMKSMHKDLLVNVNSLISEFRNYTITQTELRVIVREQEKAIKEIKETQTEIFRRINEK